MLIRPVTMPTRVFLAPGRSLNLDQRLRAYAYREGFPRSVGDIRRDLDELRTAGVPATLEEPKPRGPADRSPREPSWSLLLYTQRYRLRLREGKYHDSYLIAGIDPLRLIDHEKLADGHLRIRARGWEIRPTIEDLPKDGSARSGWDQVFREWQQVIGAQRVTALPTSQQDQFLAQLSAVIDAAERITTTADAPSYAYRRVEATGGRRSGDRQYFEFELADERVPDKDTYVVLSGGTRGRGQVTRVAGSRVTIKFDDPVSWTDLEGQGEITETASTVVYQTQRTAVRQLRDGRARNPGVLAALVDGQARPPAVRPATGEPPTEELRKLYRNPGQREAFDKAVSRPDVLVVLGPPGTGKTTTIREIVRATTQRERVIVTSHSNRAVDNVLRGLPDDLLAIRVGNDQRITADGQAYMLAAQAADARDHMLRTANENLAVYARLDQAQGWASELARRVTEMAQARASQAAAEGALKVARRTAGGPTTAEVDRISALVVDREAALLRSQSEVQRLTGLRDFAAARVGWLLIGWLLALLATRWSRRREDELSRTDSLTRETRAARVEHTAAWRHLVEVTKDVPAVRSAAGAAEAASARTASLLQAARAAADSATRSVRPMGLQPPGDDPAALSQWLSERLPQLAARKELLDGWVQDAHGDVAQLHPELLRYADVIAATCTGTGSRPELAGLDFGLAIIDEAGQIGVADALIPLVRAERAVLVGDHMQLPPFVDSDVETWGKLAGDPTVIGMLTKSALELMVNSLPPESPNVVMLTRQFRMPEVVAEFVSAQFYRKRLETPYPRGHEDDLFGSPMALVDTSGHADRWDRSGRHSERLGQPGYDNPGEAELLADLAVHYHQAGREWAVIVPYRAQQAMVIGMLQGRIADPDVIRQNVGSVDSFQGGERNVILYGFTRSNLERNIGFLKELRRVNVAISRASQQLVMIGDLTTLTKATNPGFRSLARELRDYLAQQGQVVPYETVRQWLGHATGPGKGTR
ncbi:MAG TPA: AAA domain-containing protein [Trebonia sp.]|nr:AAA domain-containing protein [Trebonia sp.]